MSTLDEWVEAAAVALELDPTAIDVPALLDLTRDVAHGVARPAAPLTAFLVGLAAGRSGGGAAEVRAAVEVVLRLLADRDAEGTGADGAAASSDGPPAGDG